jgi:SAM-dependent methyltransferase
MVEVRAFYDNSFQEYMTLKDCPYCHDSTNFTEIAKNPQTVRCNMCGLYRLYLRISRQGQIVMFKKYNEEKRDVTEWRQKLDDIKEFSQEIKRLKRFFPSVFQNGRVLDVGSAEGAFVAALKQASANPVGIEPKKDLVELGKQYGLDLHVGRFDVDGIPSDLMMKHSFDLICFRGSIYYLPDLREVFDLIATYLKPRGGIYIDTPVATSLCFLLNKDYSSILGLPVSFVPTKKSLAYILNHEGFTIQDISYYWPEYIIPVPMDIKIFYTSYHRNRWQINFITICLYYQQGRQGSRLCQ